MRQQIAVALLADCGEFVEALEPGGLLGKTDRKHIGRDAGEEIRLVRGIGKALYGGAGADAARVPADDIETVPHGLRKQHEPLWQILCALPARAAGIEEQGADATG